MKRWNSKNRVKGKNNKEIKPEAKWILLKEIWVKEERRNGEIPEEKENRKDELGREEENRGSGRRIRWEKQREKFLLNIRIFWVDTLIFVPTLQTFFISGCREWYGSSPGPGPDLGLGL